MGVTIYRASAGSGKTYALTRAFVRRLLEQGHPSAYLHQLALTFTRKATEEMKVRILGLLNDLSLPSDDKRGLKVRGDFCREWKGKGMGEEELRKRAEALRSAILHDYGRFSVYTIDAFFQRVVRSFIWEAGLPPAYTVELDSRRLLQEAVDEVVDEVSTHGQNRKWIGEMLSERIREGKRWDVQEAFNEVGRQVFDERFRSLDGTLTDKLCDKEFLYAYMQELKDWDVRFCRQMEAYAGEVLQFLDSQGLCTTDFKGKSRSFMRYFNKIKEGDLIPPDSLRKALGDDAAWAGKNDPQAGRIASVLSPLSRLIQTCIDYYDAQAPTWFALTSTLALLPQMGLSADILRHINSLLTDDNAIHLSQTLLLLSKLCSQSDTPFIWERMGCRYSDFLLDEFQDTSVLQWKTLQPLVHNGLSQGGWSWVVGDTKQAIYRWRNSDWRILGGGLRDDLHPHPCEEELLAVNWRSREVLVDTLGNLFEQLIQTVHRQFVETSVVFPQDTARIQAISQELLKVYADVKQEIAPTKKDSGGYVSVCRVAPTEQQSAKDRVLERLPHLIMELQDRGFSASDIAVLVRKNGQGQEVTSCLMAFKEKPEAKGYCFDVVSPDSLFLNQSPEVQLIVAIFKRFVHPRDALNNRLIEQLCIRLDSPCPLDLCTGPLKHYALPEAFEELIRILGWTQRTSCFPFIQELHSQILGFAKNQSGDLFSFVRWWEQNADKLTLSIERGAAAIQVLTIHKSKGLQYPVVIIPFCDWGLDYSHTQAPLLWVQPQQPPLNRLPFVPQRYGSRMAQSLFAQDYFYEKMQYRLDQLNVFYVAATRAEDELHLFLPQSGLTSHNLARILEEQLFEENADADCHRYGAPVQPAPSGAADREAGHVLACYASSAPTLRLHTRLADESPEAEITSPRKRGIILHRLLSRIRTHDDIDAAVRALVEEGMVAPDSMEQTEYMRILRKALAQTEASDWFDGSWTVRNEASILLPAAAGRSVRPDRVMEKDGRILIIDYKFGQANPAHQRQMDQYVHTLQQMGYTQVEGHVWYIPVA
ncbi:MAG: UvrD-helicase domain-containing protein [Bacteroidales bacterium]|nr:UvrD-helicase domain-containing protein [Bacteroidales bacterium]